MIRPIYECAVGFTSQFYYCGLPLRVDPYSSCRFSCTYCFAKARGGMRSASTLQVLDVAAFERRLARVETGRARGVVDELLTVRQPLHIGGMSDPFIAQENDLGVTARLLSVLVDYRYPGVISTKGILPATQRYISLLARGVMYVQFSLASMDAQLLAAVDVRAPAPRARIEAARRLVDAGVPVACRIQPLLPSRERDAYDVIDACAEAGVRHVAVEHLKMPVEDRWNGGRQLSRALGFDVYEWYRSNSAQRVGREWVLPTRLRLSTVRSLRAHTKAAGMSFAAADNDLMLMSDGACCCSGADSLPGFENFYRYNYAEAARLGAGRGEFSIDVLNGVWRPQSTIARYVNSRSRIRSDDARGAGVEAYIRRHWNGSPNGVSPTAFLGVRPTGRYDAEGYAIYSVDTSRAAEGSAVHSVA